MAEPVNPTFYGLSLDGESRCQEQETLRTYEPEHPYPLGAVIMRDGTRMAVSQEKARRAGWNDLADKMAIRGIR
jgi:hypothetical protein